MRPAVNSSARPPRPSNGWRDEARAALSTQGWWFADASMAPPLEDIVELLGRLLQTTEVCPTPASRSLVCSQDELGPHTDHYRAHYIVWRCDHAAPVGGATFVVNPWPALDSLDRTTRAEVASCRVLERRLFEDDPHDRAILETAPAGERIYLTFWFTRPTSLQQQAAVDRFRNALWATPPAFVRVLQPGDVLVVDNHRVLHGRTAFHGTRHLQRVWISDATWTPTWLPPQTPTHSNPRRET